MVSNATISSHWKRKYYWMNRMTQALAERRKTMAWSLTSRGLEDRRRLGWAVTILGVAMMIAGGTAGFLGGL
jgi:hypothetical protein